MGASTTPGEQMNKLFCLILLPTLLLAHKAASQEAISISFLLGRGFDVVAAHDSAPRAIIYLKRGGDLYRCETAAGVAGTGNPPPSTTTNGCTLIR